MQTSTFKLLRIPFSIFLMPVSFFSLSVANDINWLQAIFAFILIHLLLYPASNGYNSFMDNDTGSIGGLETPPPPTKELFYVSLIMDLAGLLLSWLISVPFFIAYLVYIIFSRAYSYRRIRLKKYPIAGYLTVIINQGALVFFMMWNASGQVETPPVLCLISATLLIGGFYPMTQIYQHEQDARDGVKTISMLLGIRGSFTFCLAINTLAFIILSYYYLSTDSFLPLLILLICVSPVLVYFYRWMKICIKNEREASFLRTMYLNRLASFCTSTGFIINILLK